MGKLSTGLERIFEFFGYKYFRYGIPFRLECKKHTEDIEKVRSFLEDDLSLQIYDATIRYRKTRIKRFLKPFFDKDIRITKTYPSGDSVTFDPTQYFPKDIVHLTDKEVFVDGGGYVGDTSLQFSEETNGKFNKIHIFEPIKRQIAIIDKNIAPIKDRVSVHCAGLSSENKKTTFEDTANMSRATTNTSNGIEVQLASLDSYLPEEELAEITYIKLDIEGEELAALHGMKETIKKYKPRLAICIYHKPEDLWEIPPYIYDLNPSYKFYIRQHEVFSETVIYAIP